MTIKRQWHLVQYENSMPEAYEALMVPPFFKPWSRKLIAFASLQGNERILDLACGTGVVARQVRCQGKVPGKIVGVDMNQGMLNVARRLNNSIQWQAANARAHPFPAAAFDLILCQAGFMFFAEATAIQEMRRVLAKSGRLAMSVWRPLRYSPGWLAIATALTEAGLTEAAAMMRSPFLLGADIEQVPHLLAVGGLASIQIRLESEMMRVSSARELLRIQAAASPIGRYVQGLDAAQLEKMIAHIGEALQAYRDDDGLALPVEAYFIRARK